MKTYCKGLSLTEDVVREAYGQWLAAPAGHKNAHRVAEEHGSAEDLIREITIQIRGRALTLRPIHHYKRREPTNGKVRVIGVHSVKQQVLDYVAVRALTPFLTARAGFYQVSSTKGKGQLFAARTLRKWSQSGGYWVHVDVRQCYPSISADLVLSILRRYVRSPDVLYVAETLLASYEGALDIGSYFSLRMAQLVLSEAYHHVEALQKTRRGKNVALVRHQIWYMDDCVLMGPDKRDLRRAVRSLERHLAAMGLELKPWKICRVSDEEPIDLAGYVVRPSRTTIRSGIFLRARKAFRTYDHHPTLKGAYRVCSYWGWLTTSNSRGHRKRSEADRIFNHARQTISAASKGESHADHPVSDAATPRHHRDPARRAPGRVATPQYHGDTDR